MFSTEAIKFEVDRRARATTINDVVRSVIPENPKPGTYWWWADMARENTGYHFLDSGMMFGYKSGHSIPREDIAAWVTTDRDGVPESATINTIYHLTQCFEIDETAKALQKIFEWAGLWIWPRESWGTIKDNMPGVLAEVYRAMGKRAGKPILRKRGGPDRHCEQPLHLYVEDALADLTYQSQFYSWQWKLTDEEYVNRALKEFPVEAAKHLHAENLVQHPDWRAGVFTPNYDNDFDQDWGFGPVFYNEDMDLDYGRLWGFVNTHNGADIRGAWSTPRAVMMPCETDLLQNRAEVYCTKCGESDSFYRWQQRAEEIPWPPNLSLWREKLELLNQRRYQPPLLPGEDFKWELPFGPSLVREIVKRYDAEEDHEDFQFPLMISQTPINGNGHRLFPVERLSVDADQVLLWCSACRDYTVHVNGPCYGC